MEAELMWFKPVLDKEIHKCRELNQPLFTCFVDYINAFDSVEHQQLWTVMRGMGFPKQNRVANRSIIH